ncbi:MAG: thioredoxin family protein [Opitutales bacterium]|nr:thioredoxin family protein [Opitutales bacterium]
MKDIKVLGTGCKKCQMLAETADQAAKEMAIEYSLEKVTDLNAIMSYGVMFTPALVIDGEVKVSGKVPSIEAVKLLLA